MNEHKANLLAVSIQKKFPIHPRPFYELAKELDETEETIIEQILEWKSKRYLREISAVMEGETLGYDSALVCGKVPKERLKDVAGILHKHPTITHLYEREHDFNLWFTIATPPEMILEDHLQILSLQSGVSEFYPLRRTHTFKIGVVIDLEKMSNQTEKQILSESKNKINLSPKERLIVRVIQSDLPVEKYPFRVIASQFDLNESDILDFLNKYNQSIVRKYIGTFNHRKLGVFYNAMTVWNIPMNDLEKKGNLLAEFPEVSHCYARNAAPNFPYTLYSMLHSHSEESIQIVIKNCSKTLDCNDYRILFSPTEFKKMRLRYFLLELDEWWNGSKHLIGK